MVYPITKYLSEKQANEVLAMKHGWWQKRSEVGIKYKCVEIKGLEADRKKNVAKPRTTKNGDKVYAVKTKKGIALSLVYGYNEHLELPETVTYSSWWFDKPKKWSKICKEVSL